MAYGLKASSCHPLNFYKLQYQSFWYNLYYRLLNLETNSSDSCVMTFIHTINRDLTEYSNIKRV